MNTAPEDTRDEQIQLLKKHCNCLIDTTRDLSASLLRLHRASTEAYRMPDDPTGEWRDANNAAADLLNRLYHFEPPLNRIP